MAISFAASLEFIHLISHDLEGMMTAAIKSLHRLRNAGVFADIVTGDGGPEFSKFNVIYGFNGCGKTTIARIMDSIASQQLNPNLPDQVSFVVQFDDNEQATEASLGTTASSHLCVFCEDFVERTLAWKDAKASPIIYIGEAQADIAEKLKGLEAAETAEAANHLLRSAEWSAADKAQNQYCTNVARMISEELAIVRGYDARRLKQDYEGDFSPNDKLSEDERQDLKRQILLPDPPAKLPALVAGIKPEEALGAARNALALQIEQIAIEALDRRQDALPWVERGLELHAEETECLFCGGSLLSARKDALREALQNAFEQVAAALEDARTRVQEIRNATAAKLSELAQSPPIVAELAVRAEACRSELKRALELMHDSCENVMNLLSAKIADPSSQQKFPDDFRYTELLHEIGQAIGNFNDVIEEHNALVENFDVNKSLQRERLKRHFLADTKGEYVNLSALQADTRKEFDASESKLRALREQMQGLRDEMREHGPAADRLNQLISSYLGHSRISVLPDDEGYQICRDGVPSLKPLSEGEKTALAFCYFVVSLESEGRNLGDLIIIVDDPISSLDARAMGHMVSLVKFAVGKCHQLVILTHNLDFLREMKKWLNSKRKSGEAQFIFIQTIVKSDGSRESSFADLPAIIREYESEYHYLFSLIYKAAHDADNSEGHMYLLPNALRKVLETYLAFKQPGYSDLGGLGPLIEAHDSVDAMKVRALEALAQTESHAQSIGDTITFSQFTLEQIADAARAFLHLVEATDPMHFERMEKLCRKAP